MINAHHSIVDAWSLDVLMAEFGALMHDELLPPPLGQMGDHIEREAAFLAGGADAQRRFWAAELGVPLPELDLSHGARTDAGAAVGGFKPLLLDCVGAGELLHAARQYGVTPFVVALSAFAAALHRWTLHDRLVIGIPSVCRNDPEDEGIVGFLTNTLPLVLEVDAASPFTTLVAHVAERLAAAITCQRLPLDEILDCRARAGTRGAEGPIRTMFVLQDTPLAGGLRLPGCTVSEVALHNGTAKMDLTLTLRSDGEAIVGGLEFARAALSDAEASAFGAAFLAILRAGLRQPGLPVGALPAQSPETMTAHAAAANQACADYGALPPLVSGILDRCREAPEAIALASRSETMTYGELERASAAAASALAAGGVGRETLVGLCMERSIAYITAMLGILRAGGAFVPLSPAVPAERNRTIAREARLRYIVADAEAGGVFLGLPVRIWQPGELAGPGGQTLAPVLPEQLAFCYFTSGSTGIPKGVAIDHRCAMGRLEWVRRRYAFALGGALVHKTPLIFDVAIWEIFAPLLDGATVLLAGVGEEVDPLVLARFIRGETVGIHFVPSLLDAFLKSAPPASPSSLQWLQLSGEAPSPELVTRARAYFGCELHNCYGQTETSEVTCWEDDGKPLGQRVPIGSQVGIYRVFLVDGGLNLVPDGMPGEIAVAAVGGLARGYVGNPRLTAERFVPNAFARESGERLYLTGDMRRARRLVEDITGPGHPVMFQVPPSA
jgi:amino acid adenylation domain-containing protein